MKLQTTITAILISLFLIFSACSNDTDPIIKDKLVNAISGDRVDLVAFNGDSYSWSQVSGRSVILINANTDTLSFIAPDVNQTETLLFEVQALMPSITDNAPIRKERATVTVHPLAVLSDKNITTPIETNTTTPTDTNVTVPSDNNITTPADANTTTQTENNTTVANDNNITTPTDTNTTIPTNPLKSILLRISNNSLNIDENTSLNAIATYEDKTTKDITNEVEWISTDSNAIEISKRHLKAKKETNIILQAKLNTITSNAVALEIYQNINGHRLPPEPNKTLNDSTLLGIDTNNNGVRDDVERWIYKKYEKKHPVHIDIAMQAGRAWQKVLVDPSKAKEIHPIISGASSCEAYYEVCIENDNELYISEWINTKYFRKKICFNTSERLKAYYIYDKLLSGDSYTIPWCSEKQQLCDFNTTKYEK